MSLLFEIKKNIFFRISLAWGLALFALLTSLFFSEVLKYPPCSLCWYQRVFMYPLVFIIPVGLFYKDAVLFMYVRVLSAIGFIIALYHSIIYHDIIQEALKVCTASLSCNTKQFELFGFLSIPVMSLFSFLFILLLTLKGGTHEKGN